MLYEIFQSNSGKEIDKWLHYFPVYERFFKDFVNKSLFMLEIGVGKGGSLQMWKKYFGPFATIVGIDINNDCKNHEDDQCKVRIGSQSDLQFLAGIIKEFGKPDIVLDDGSHIMSDMDTAFKFLYPLLNNNGVYIVEDAHTCYWEDFEGGLKNPNSFIEKAKEMIDSLNAYHIQGQNMVNHFTESTFSISFFDSMVVFEKKWHDKPYGLRKGSS